MTPVSDITFDRLCAITVAAATAGSEMNGTAHAAYYMVNNTDPWHVIHQLRNFKEAFGKLVLIMPLVDDVLDELEGRKPVVKVDEQEAA